MSDKMNELSNREFIKRLEQKIPSKKVNFDNPVDVKEFFGDEDFLEYEEVFKD
ncbi:MAG: antitoxin [Streptococcus infantarius]|nr:antitoxin [Streptococcus infantarius]